MKLYTWRNVQSWGESDGYGADAIVVLAPTLKTARLRALRYVRKHWSTYPERYPLIVDRIKARKPTTRSIVSVYYYE